MTEPREDEGDEARTMSFLGAAGWTIALSLSREILVQVTEKVRPGAESDIINLTACLVLACSTVLFVMLRVYARATRMRDAFGLRAVTPVHVVLGATAGAAMYPLFATVDGIIEKRFPLSADEAAAQARLLAVTTTGSRVLLVVTLGVVVPIALELFFRGMLAGRLLRGRAPSIVVIVTAIYFAASSTDPRGFATTLALGLTLGWLRTQSGSVLPAIAAQLAYGAVPLVPVLAGRDPAEDVRYPPKWIAIATGIAVLAMIAAASLAARDQRARAARALDE
jgi:membrane protease YdiL (CAAX protease family)